MAVYVLVPGGWLGGWCWRYVAAPLAAAGHHPVAVTLTGLGERSHLLTPSIDLATHVADVARVMFYEDLQDVILVGHSYGCTVITAAAEQVAQRLRCLVYLDGPVPTDGQSNNDGLPHQLVEQLRERVRREGDGWRLPPPAVLSDRIDAATAAWVTPRLTEHPSSALEQPVRLGNQAAMRLPHAFLLTSGPGGPFQPMLDRGRRQGWYCRELDGGHYAMLTAPAALAGALMALERACGPAGWDAGVI